MRTTGIVIGLIAMASLALSAPLATADQIAYSCGGDICLINPDNSEEHSNLTESNLVTDEAPAWAPDGNLIAFVGYYFGSSDIFTLDPTKTGEQQDAVAISETPDRAADNRPPAWSPDGTRIAFAERFNSNEAPNLESEVYVAPREGNTDPVAIDSTSNKSELTPTWSPDSSTLVFSREGVLWKGPPDNSAKPTILSNSYGYEPAWSPDGTRIATVTFTDPEHIRITKADGSGFVEVPTNSDLSSTVDWSPDSSQVTFVGDEPSTDQIRVAPADGSSAGHVIPMPDGWIVPHNPVFSPDGTRVAFDARSGGVVGEQVLVAPSDGSAPAVPITKSEQNNEEPRWKPCEGCAPPAKPQAPPPPGQATKVPTKIRPVAFNHVVAYPRLSVMVNCFAEGGHPDPKYCNGDGIAKVVTYTGALRSWAKPKLKKKTIVFAKGSVKVPGGESKPLVLKVTAAGKKLAKPGKTLKVQVAVRLSRDSEKAQTFKQTVKVKVPKKKG